MGLFGSSKKISSEREIKKILRSVRSLSGSERKAAKKLLDKYDGGGGLSKNELKRLTRDMKKNRDSFSTREANAIRRKFDDQFDS